MKDLKELVKDVERDLVINIVLGVRYKRLTLKEAKTISKSFMASFPYKDHKELFEKLYILGSKHRAVRKVFVKYFQDYEKEEIEKTLVNMRIFIKINDFENAIKVARGGSYG